jgi:hypothetical protein
VCVVGGVRRWRLHGVRHAGLLPLCSVIVRASRRYSVTSVDSSSSACRRDSRERGFEGKRFPRKGDGRPPWGTRLPPDAKPLASRGTLAPRNEPEMGFGGTLVPSNPIVPSSNVNASGLWGTPFPLDPIESWLRGTLFPHNPSASGSCGMAFPSLAIGLQLGGPAQGSKPTSRWLPAARVDPRSFARSSSACRRRALPADRLRERPR